MLNSIKDLFDESGPNLRARLVAIYAVLAVLNVAPGSGRSWPSAITPRCWASRS